ncbi:UNVERIFIED_CONTAM: hypothetical protein Sradi_6996500 [Sesamum radiatum]|uniref:Uncharacterized protein n=1 Tax=Sesamum radiatum TaxID=300843 RepID=A0AAW2JCE6_SESRA
METPSNALKEEKAMETVGSAKALQVVPGAPRAPASGITVLEPHKPIDVLTKPPTGVPPQTLPRGSSP